MTNLFKKVKGTIDARPLTQPSREYMEGERNRVDSELEKIKTLLRNLIDQHPSFDQKKDLEEKKSQKEEKQVQNPTSEFYTKDFRTLLERLREFTIALEAYHVVMSKRDEVAVFYNTLLEKIKTLKAIETPITHPGIINSLRDTLDVCIQNQTAIHSACRHCLVEHAQLEIENQKVLNRQTCTIS